MKTFSIDNFKISDFSEAELKQIKEFCIKVLNDMGWIKTNDNTIFDLGYNEGIKRAWSAARNLIFYSRKELDEIFTNEIWTSDRNFIQLNALDAIEKIEWYQSNIHLEDIEIVKFEDIMMQEDLGDYEKLITAETIEEAVDRGLVVKKKNEELTIEKAIEFLHENGWMEEHDKEMYNHGLNVAWDIIRLIYNMTESEIDKIFRITFVTNIVRALTIQEVIDKLKAYDENIIDSILLGFDIGDEVILKDTETKMVITYKREYGKELMLSGLNLSDNLSPIECNASNCIRTGKSYKDTINKLLNKK